MIHVMKKIADWIVENERRAATDCSVPNEIIDEWLDTIEEHKKRIQEDANNLHAQQLEMLLDLERKVKEIEEIRKTKCYPTK